MMFKGSVLVRIGTYASATLIVLGACGFIEAAQAGNRKAAPDDQGEQRALLGKPVIAVVSIKDQHISVYDAEGRALRSRVSTGQTGYETPVGVFSVLEKQEEHYSNVYDDASMPFMQRITWSGIALHAGVLPGYPASHGCVRLSEDFAQQLFPLTKVGLRVVISHNDVAPSEISHPLLLKPAPAAEAAALALPATYETGDSDDSNASPFQADVARWPARAAQMEGLKAIAAQKAVEADTASERADELKAIVTGKSAIHARALKVLHRAEAEKKRVDDKLARAVKLLADAKKPDSVSYAERVKAKADAAVKIADDRLTAAKADADTAEKELASATEAWKPAGAVKTAAVAAAQEAKWKMLPVSVFISLKTQRLYVRQGNEPVFDAPVTVANPDQPIGTHIFTAVDYKDQGKDFRWTVVSIGQRSPDELDQVSYNRRRRDDADGDARPTDVALASAALDRVTIPPEVASRISPYVWPGSSMIVSDEALSAETGKATDFIVVSSTEPQGGLKKRPKKPAPSFYDRDGFYDGYDGYDRYDPYGRRDMRYRPKPSFFNWW